VDEARTPLIISGPGPNAEQLEAFRVAAGIAQQLNVDADYKINSRYREIELTDQGHARLAQIAAPLSGLWHGRRRREELVTQALVAKELYLLNQHYIRADGKIVIVDDFTGRLMPDRSWRDGLHQAIEAKEGLEVTTVKDTYARISFQRFFRLYKTLSGMTGTAQEGATEFWQIYNHRVVVIPTHRPCIRKVLPDLILPTKAARWQRLLSEIRQIHNTGRPLLLGTRSVRDSEYLSQRLTAEQLDHQVLNAVRHREEAQIIAGAGQAGRITVATNMAGRGTDIKLGRGVADLGGLAVIATERHESGRVDRQLYGRACRQGDPGSAQMFVCLEDELMVRHAPHMRSSLVRRYGHNEEEISSNFVRRVYQMAQGRAERMSLRQRKSVLSTDDWLDQYLGFAGSEK
jgi:preprotein translocase subunit SecA